MKITMYGTRGSLPVAGKQFAECGGNTTCVGIESPCLPRHMALAIDAGSGFRPFSDAALRTLGGLKQVAVLMTHYHHDHTQGFPLSQLMFMDHVTISCVGVSDGGYGPREVMENLIQPPFFPVSFDRLGSHFAFHTIKNPDSRIIAFHPEGGVQMLTVEQFKRAGNMVSFGETKGKYPATECLIVRMHWTNHPERTVSYRFEEGLSGKVFVFLTDHENQDRMSADMRRHLAGADLLIMDSQYSRKVYDERAAGFGHGTPDFCVRTALEVGAKKLGLTHHDPSSDDEAVSKIREEAEEAYTRLRTVSSVLKDIVVCRDFDVYELVDGRIPIVH